MANSRYSTIRNATVSTSDIEILYTFSPDRETPNNGNIGKLEPASQYLQPFFSPQSTTEILGGLYNLTLPSTVFNQAGFYTLIIRPKQIRTKIVDCGILSALPNEKGLVLDLTNATDNSGANIDLTNLVPNLGGYRIEYLNTVNGQQTLRENYFTIVTSANKAEAVSANISNITQKATQYRLTDTGKLLYLSVSPQSTSSVKPNSKPFIGEPGQSIILTNTNFNPQIIELNLTNYDIDSLAIGLFGAQIRNVQNGEVTYYRDDLTIYQQSLLYDIKDEFNNPLYQVKQPKKQIDTSQDFTSITSNVE